MVGLSYGGTTTLFLAAWDDAGAGDGRQRLLLAWQAAHRVPWNLCGSQVLPGMLGEIEHVDLGALIAPRALLVETGTEDPIFPVEAARRDDGRLADGLRRDARRARAARARRVRRRPPLARRRASGSSTVAGARPRGAVRSGSDGGCLI